MSDAIPGDRPRATGSCLCGGVRYEVHGELTPLSACHCSQCARTSGNFVVSTNSANEALKLTASESLRWYRSSPQAERGFCAICGGNLFWRAIDGVKTSITAGTLDPPTGLSVERHIYTGSKSDFYEITDGAPQHETW